MIPAGGRAGMLMRPRITMRIHDMQMIAKVVTSAAVGPAAALLVCLAQRFQSIVHTAMQHVAPSLPAEDWKLCR